MRPYIKDDICIGRLIAGNTRKENVMVETVLKRVFISRISPIGHLESAKRADL
jgi:hypothetical protein